MSEHTKATLPQYYMVEQGKTLLVAQEAIRDTLGPLRDACQFGAESTCEEVLIARLAYSAWQLAAKAHETCGYSINRLVEISEAVGRKPRDDYQPEGERDGNAS